MALSVFLTIIVLLKLLTFSTSEETCEKVDVCSCKLKNGSTVNLKPVDRGSKGPRYKTFTSLSVQARSYVVISSKSVKSASAGNSLYFVFKVFSNWGTCIKSKLQVRMRSMPEVQKSCTFYTRTHSFLKYIYRRMLECLVRAKKASGDNSCCCCIRTSSKICWPL